MSSRATGKKNITSRLIRKALGVCAAVFAAGGACSWAAAVEAGRAPADVLAAAGRLRDPAARDRVVEALRADESARLETAREKARRLGLPLKGSLPGGGAFEIADFDGDQPRYRMTLNYYAGISVAANKVWSAPYGVSGSLGIIGLWDGSGARVSHREFGGRITVKDGSTDSLAHSTHVAGTLCASGVSFAAKGLAPAARVDSYDWNSDISEMTSSGASYPGEPGKIAISSHSYTYSGEGWIYSTDPLYTWYGVGTDASGYDDDFGQYDTRAAGADALAYSLPHYLMFWAAGNDRGDTPVYSNSVRVGAVTTAYDPALHPPADNVYKGGYDTIGHDPLAKNVVTVGNVEDAVSVTSRDIARAFMHYSSSWGPSDDGRIKPDLVANGYSVYSSINGGDASYSYMTGTSMATPGAAATAQLLAHYLATLFTNTAPRASTLKALLIHTADDLGNAGPDYKFGWGLINAQAAADLLKAYSTNAGSRRVVEDRLVPVSRTYVDTALAWDGVSPLRATLCWTDPAGAATATHDSRTVRLVNNLDLRILGPTGAVYRPWVMPYVGNWATNALATPATSGSNTTDNVEQVLVASPGAPGVYTARVTYAGTLSGGVQAFSLLFTGGSGAVRPPAPLVTASSPSSGTGTNLFTISGDRFQVGADVRLRRAAEPDVKGFSVEPQGDLLEARLDTTGMSDGWWHLYVTNPDGRRAVFYNAFVVGSAGDVSWSEDFETDNLAAKGWTFSSLVGSSQWALTTAAYVSPTRALFSPAVETRSDTAAVSPAVALPAQGVAFALAFWHAFSFEVNDGGILELSVDGGASWYSVTAFGSGASFAANGYNATIGSAGGNKKNPLAGYTGWSGNSGGFIKTVVNLTDTAKYAGKSVKIRWRLGTNTGTSSPGWTVDDVTVTCMVPPDMTKGSVLSVR